MSSSPLLLNKDEAGSRIEPASTKKTGNKQRVEKTMFRSAFSWAVVTSALLAVTGCTYSGGNIADPGERKFHWKSFVAGDDIRQSCQTGTPNRYRLVYNGDYEKQFRVYEIDDMQEILAVTVSKPGHDFTATLDDLLAPWRAIQAKVQLDQEEYDRLQNSFGDSGAFAPPTPGLELPSNGYYWTAAYCRDGHFGFTGWLYPSSSFDHLSFPAQLFALDSTGVTPVKPGPITFDAQRADDLRKGRASSFTLKIGSDGLVR